MSKNTSAVENTETHSPGNLAEAAKSADKIINIKPQSLLATGTSLSRKNKDPKYQKPIEDFHLVDNRNMIFIVMDGATRYVIDGGTYPDPSPAAHAAKLITNTCHQVLAASIYNKLPARDILQRAASTANDLLRYDNLEKFPKVDFLENDFANACGILSYIKDDRLYYAYLGDPLGCLVRNGSVSIFTKNQTAKIEELYTEYSRDSKKNMVDLRKHICGDVRNNKDHAYAFGTFTGEARALDLLEFGELPLQAGDRVILISDGLLPLILKQPELLLSRDYNQLFDEMDKLEISDNIRSDDKTLLAIDIST